MWKKLIWVSVFVCETLLCNLKVNTFHSARYLMLRCALILPHFQLTLDEFRLHHKSHLKIYQQILIWYKRDNNINFHLLIDKSWTKAPQWLEYYWQILLVAQFSSDNHSQSIEKNRRIFHGIFWDYKTMQIYFDERKYTKERHWKPKRRSTKTKYVQKYIRGNISNLATSLSHLHIV